MPKLLALICYLVAFICFLLAAFAADKTRFNLVAVGLAAWVLVPLVDVAETFS